MRRVFSILLAALVCTSTALAQQQPWQQGLEQAPWQQLLVGRWLLTASVGRCTVTAKVRIMDYYRVADSAIDGFVESYLQCVEGDSAEAWDVDQHRMVRIVEVDNNKALVVMQIVRILDYPAVGESADGLAWAGKRDTTLTRILAREAWTGHIYPDSSLRKAAATRPVGNPVRYALGHWVMIRDVKPPQQQ